jgi:hypothetical protein
MAVRVYTGLPPVPRVGPVKRSLMTCLGQNKVDCLKLHRNFGYMVKQLKNAPEDQLEGRAKAVLEHHFEHHEHCDSSWCHRKNMSAGELANDRGKKGKYYCCKERDSREYELLKSIVDKYTSIERLCEVAHGHSTQMNESMNNTIAWLAQKNKTLSGSVAPLSLRIHLAVGINLVGYEPYLAELLNQMGITLTKLNTLIGSGYRRRNVLRNVLRSKKNYLTKEIVKPGNVRNLTRRLKLRKEDMPCWLWRD